MWIGWVVNMHVREGCVSFLFVDLPTGHLAFDLDRPHLDTQAVDRLDHCCQLHSPLNGYTGNTPVIRIFWRPRLWSAVPLRSLLRSI
jgi:hypothetical protein